MTVAMAWLARDRTGARRGKASRAARSAVRSRAKRSDGSTDARGLPWSARVSSRARVRDDGTA